MINLQDIRDLSYGSVELEDLKLNEAIELIAEMKVVLNRYQPTSQKHIQDLVKVKLKASKW